MTDDVRVDAESPNDGQDLTLTDAEWSDAEFQKEWQEQAEKIGRFNLAIFGKTGVGKSTLINAIFGEEVAPTGVGRPVTMDSNFYEHRDGFLGVFDSRGLEIGKDTEAVIAELEAEMKKRREGPLSDQIHVAWYCFRADGRRFEDTEAEFIRRLDKLGLPIVGVLTQVSLRDGKYHPDSEKLAEEIAALNLPIVGGRPVMVMAAGDTFENRDEHGLKDLLDATFRVAPEGVEAALIAAQKVDMGRKRKQAKDVARISAATALAVAAIPIPVASAGLLIPIQLGMMARIAAIYGVRVETASLAAAAATTVATAAGRAAFVSLLKLIPGAGWAVGGVIGGAIASSFTMAMGYSWAYVCGEITQGRLVGADGALDNDMIRELFQAQVVVWFERVRAGKD